MHRCKRTIQSLFFLSVIALSPLAFAQGATDPSAVTPEMAAPADEPAAPAEAAAKAGTVAVPIAAADPNAAKYGMAFRMRWVSVPSWFLGLFTQKNVPLSSYGWAVEGYRRKIDRDDPNRTWELVVGIGYQNMSMPDGYWLGKGKDPAQDADLVQARNFGLITMDAAFVSRQYFSSHFGIHYGAGLGLAVVRGKILRTSATYDRPTNTYTVVDRNGRQMCDTSANCNEGLLQDSSRTQPDNGPGDPHRFQETSVPGAIPIINVLAGVDFPFRLPNNQILEFRLEGGFFDAFFLGGAMGYVF